MKKCIKYVLIVFCVFYWSQSLFAQVYKRHETQMALVVRIAEHISWPSDSTSANFKIALLSDDNVLNNSFKVFAQKRKLKNRPVEVRVYKQINSEILNNDLVFISSNKLNYYEALFDRVEGQPILLVSDLFEDKKLVMINFYNTEDNKLNFEINKANIINQGLSIDDEVLLVGGSMIDVAELYRKSQQSLRWMEKELDKNQILFDSLQQQVESVEKEINNKNQTIEKQQCNIEKDKLLIQHHLVLIDSQTTIVKSQRTDIKDKRQALESLKDELGEQKHLFNVESEKYNDLQGKLNSLDEKIILNEQILGEQSLKISKQKQLIVYAVFVIAIIVMLLVIIIVAFRNIRKKGIVLEDQKAEIQEINHELQTSNEELNEKNEELYSTLDKLKTTQNQLLHTEKMASLGVLTAGIAHELNNPLNFVYGGVNNIIRDLQDVIPVLSKIRELEPDENDLKEKYLQILELIEELEFFTAVEAIQETVHDIKLGADRAVEIVRGMRNFSRTEKEEWQEMDIHDSINDVLILLQNKYKTKVELVKHFDAGVSNIQCKRDKVNQALMNVINNAIDAIPDKGTIIISTKQNKNIISVSIKDDGVGIDEELQKKIFDPFFSTKQVGEGVGLGLSITFSAIEIHNGSIKVNSEPGKGSEFIINLPVNQV